MQRHRRGWVLRCAVAAAAVTAVLAGCEGEETKAAASDTSSPAATTPGVSEAPDVQPQGQTPEGPSMPGQPDAPDNPADTDVPETPDPSEQPDEPDEPEKPKPPRRDRRPERSDEPLLETSKTEMV
ncbi:MAG: hypothetical protein ACOC7R_04975 [Planctomycetota bacterium]